MTTTAEELEVKTKINFLGRIALGGRLVAAIIWDSVRHPLTDTQVVVRGTHVDVERLSKG